MMQNGLCYVLPTWERHTNGNESSSWPTPAAQDGKNSTLPPSQEHRDTLPGQLIRQGQQGYLNPEFVETLMGFPQGWTDISGLHDLESTNMSGNHPESFPTDKEIA
jgi:hypothetical protein